MKYKNKVRYAFDLYSAFSYASGLIWFFLDILPQFLRRNIFKIVFKKFGQNCMVDYKCFVRYPWKVIVGDNVSINRGCEIFSSMQTGEGVITFEDHAVLGPNVVIFAAGHSYSSIDLPDISAPVVIGRYAWIGGNTTILPGVVIGEGSVVGAGSVVSKSIPAYSVAVGNPAKVIKMRLLDPISEAL
jgi:acetyltransferase-like isoleucine patch superfamily enzyme